MACLVMGLFAVVLSLEFSTPPDYVFGYLYIGPILLACSHRVHSSLNYGASDFRQFLWVNGDTLQLQRVVANLLINAITIRLVVVESM